jgi:hypothetical protein
LYQKRKTRVSFFFHGASLGLRETTRTTALVFIFCFFTKLVNVAVPLGPETVDAPWEDQKMDGRREEEGKREEERGMDEGGRRRDGEGEGRGRKRGKKKAGGEGRGREVRVKKPSSRRGRRTVGKKKDVVHKSMAQEVQTFTCRSLSFL